MDLSNIIIPEGLEFKPAMTTCTIEGILEEDDLRALLGCADAIPADDNPNDLKRIKEKHHHVARLIADGLTQSLVASICGYTESYLSVLLNAPAMAELVELYRIKNGAAVSVATEKLKTVGLKALERLDERIEKDELNNNELIGAAKLGLDRGGHGPQNKTEHLTEHHIFDHTRLAALNAEARRRNTEYIVPQEEVRAALAHKATDESKKEPPSVD